MEDKEEEGKFEILNFPKVKHVYSRLLSEDEDMISIVPEPLPPVGFMLRQWIYNNTVWRMDMLIRRIKRKFKL